MARHITVVSYTQTLNQFLEKVVLTLRHDGREHGIIRCQEHGSLKGLVRQAGGERADQLDLVGHARPDEGELEGHFLLGDLPLLESGKEPPPEFKSLGEVLPPEASVRLLGCYTGALIQAASAALGGRKVSGTMDLLWADDFDEHGLMGKIVPLVSTEEPPPLQLEDIYRQRWTDEDLEAARKWQRFLPAEYELTRRGEPLVRVEASRAWEDAKVSFASARRLVLIEDEPGRPPLVLRWRGSTAPPPLQELMAALPNGS